jgi:hypothetical protein
MGTTQPMSPARRFVMARVFPWTIVLVGAGAIYIGVENTVRARASAGWPEVDGVVVLSGVERVIGSSSSASTPGRGVTYRANVVYDYAVDGKPYQGTRISYGHYDTEEESDAARVVANYPNGKRVKVRVMPGSPGEAVLEPGSAGLPWFYAGLGGTFLLIGLALAVLMPKFVARSG